MDAQIKIADKSYNLRFTLGVFDHLQEITGQDGITFVNAAGTNVVFGCYALILAAGRCYSDKYNSEQINDTQLMKAVKEDGSVDIFYEIIAMYNKFMNPEPKAKMMEQTTKTESQSPSQESKNTPSEVLA